MHWSQCFVWSAASSLSPRHIAQQISLHWISTPNLPNMPAEPFIPIHRMVPLLHFFLIIISQFRQNLAQNSQQQCSDGSPASFPCNPARVSSRLIYVCAGDHSLGCEQIGEQFFCCADNMESQEEPENMTLITGKDGFILMEMELLERLNETVEQRDNMIPTLDNLATVKEVEEQINRLVIDLSDRSGNRSATNLAPSTAMMMTTEMITVSVESAPFSVVDGSVEGLEEGKGKLILTTPFPQTTLLSRSSLRPICVDIGPQCFLSAKLCDNPQYSRLVRLQCPRTCNICSADGMRIKIDETKTEKCFDRGKDCSKIRFLCSTSAFKTLMAVECAKTCGKCTEKESQMTSGVVRIRSTGGVEGIAQKPKETDEDCADNYPRCAIWRLQGFCTSPVYNKFLRQRYCAKTCALCEGKSPFATQELIDGLA